MAQGRNVVAIGKGHLYRREFAFTLLFYFELDAFSLSQEGIAGEFVVWQIGDDAAPVHKDIRCSWWSVFGFNMPIAFFAIP